MLSRVEVGIQTVESVLMKSQIIIRNAIER